MITLGEVSELASALVAADREVESREIALKQAKENARILREESLPSAMQELGLTQLKLTTGQSLTIKQEVYCSVPADKRAEAFAWLEANGFGGLIKSDVELHFGKNEAERMGKVVSLLADAGYDPEVSRSVHPQTLKAFIREQLEKAGNVPLELFGARPVFTAVIK